MNNLEKLNEKARIDNLVMKSIKVQEISHVIANTNKGQLTLRLNLGGTGKDYRFVLDAVPFNEKDSDKLLGLLEDYITK